MFKKRNVEKKVDLAKDIEDIEIGHHDQPPEQNDQKITVPKSILTKKINKFSNQIKKEPEPEPNQQKKAPIIVKYGLIDKQDVNSKYHANQQTQEKKQPEKHSIVNLYVKKKMEELAMVKEEGADKVNNANTEQIIQMQKKYLEMSEQKLAEYDIVEIMKKLQNMATNSIKQETENRNSYLKNLLENEHEKMEYASKKELKTIRQQKQRMQHEFQNKYNDSGRRGYVEKIKYQAMFGK